MVIEWKWGNIPLSPKPSSISLSHQTQIHWPLLSWESQFHWPTLHCTSATPLSHPVFTTTRAALRLKLSFHPLPCSSSSSTPFLSLDPPLTPRRPLELLPWSPGPHNWPRWSQLWLSPGSCPSDPPLGMLSHHSYKTSTFLIRTFASMHWSSFVLLWMGISCSTQGITPGEWEHFALIANLYESVHTPNHFSVNDSISLVREEWIPIYSSCIRGVGGRTSWKGKNHWKILNISNLFYIFSFFKDIKFYKVTQWSKESHIVSSYFS